MLDLSVYSDSDEETSDRSRDLERDRIGQADR